MRREGIMLCYPFEEKRLPKWSRPYLTQPKLDGDRCRAIPLEDRWMLVTSEGNEITSCPHILQQLNNIPRHSWMELDGELYNHDLTHSEIHAIVSRTVNIHEDYEEAEFHVFDVVSETLPQTERIQLLNHVVNASEECGNTHIKMVKVNIAKDAQEITDHYFSYIEQGYEGIVVRNPVGPYRRKRSTDVMKFKPKKKDWYQITGFKEEIDKDGNPKRRLGAFLCDDGAGGEFSVGSGMTNAQREKFWTQAPDLIGYFVCVEYQHIISKSQTPRFPIFVEIDEVSGE